MRIGGFLRDQRGTSFEGIALSVSLIAVAFVASADMLDFMTKSNTTVASEQTKTFAMTHGNLDETPTGSLPELEAHSVLDPCTGAVKQP